MESARRPARARMSGEERRRQIVEVACVMFADRGYRGTTVRDIAREAAINEAVIYQHFPSKEALFAASLNAKIDEFDFEPFLSSLSRDLPIGEILAAIAPLLGLLGTVTGMISTFQSITLFGTGDPKLMAGGISQALVTTVLGLVVAIPLILLHTFVGAKSKRLIEVLEEQGAGIVARHAEQE